MVHFFYCSGGTKYRRNVGIMQITVPAWQQKKMSSSGRVNPGITLADFGFGLLLTVPLTQTCMFIIAVFKTAHFFLSSICSPCWKGKQLIGHT